MENYVYSVCPPKQTCYRISTYGFQIEAFLRKKFGKYVLFRGDFICNKFITIKKSGDCIFSHLILKFYLILLYHVHFKIPVRSIQKYGPFSYKPH